MMTTRTSIVPLVILAVTVSLSAGSEYAVAQSHPQEVLVLIAGHDALAMKVRPLHDRIAMAAKQDDGDIAFQPDGTPVRAKAAVAEILTGRTVMQIELRVLLLVIKPQGDHELVGVVGGQETVHDNRRTAVTRRSITCLVDAGGPQSCQAARNNDRPFDGSVNCRCTRRALLAEKRCELGFDIRARTVRGEHVDRFDAGHVVETEQRVTR